jgi:stage III sporulation protein AA
MQMKCEWDKLLAILPNDLREPVNRLGKESLQELRLRLGIPVQLILRGTERCLDRLVTMQDLLYVINTASKYSPWAAQGMTMGYITAPGGHRIGIFGETIVKDGNVSGIRKPSSLCLRVARQYTGIADRLGVIQGNILIAGPPGSGKTTLLRDVIRSISEQQWGAVAVVDERGELFPEGCGFTMGPHTDVLTGCTKPCGIEMALKTMGPAVIAVDEITSEADCDALGQAVWCGVRLVATVHASGKADLFGRRIYRKLLDSGYFDRLLVLNRDKSWTEERMFTCKFNGSERS